MNKWHEIFMNSHKEARGRFFKEYQNQGGQIAYQFISKDALDWASQDHCQPYIIREIIGEPLFFPREIQEWAEEFIYRTERFDRIMCGEDGIPRNGWQIRECNKNAREIKQEYIDRCIKKRYDVNILNKLIRELDRDLERIMKKY